MISYGFFNSVSGDRKYNADTFNTFFEGLISSSGVFQNVGSGFAVTASGTGTTLNVGTGKALVNNCWVRSTAVETKSLAAADGILNRYDAIVLRWESASRDITLEVLQGTSATNPVKPTLTRNSASYEICLAYIYIAANASTITQANITDARPDSSVCGFINTLVDHIDTSELYAQYNTQFEELSTQMQAWFAEEQADFNTWFSALTDQLQVNTYVSKTEANVTLTEAQRYIDFPSGVDYVAANKDVLEVYLNGMRLVENIDYTVMQNEVENVPMLYMSFQVPATNTFTIVSLKSKIGQI